MLGLTQPTNQLEHEPIAPVPAPAPAIVVLGVGNDYRSDDSAGLLVARELEKLVPGNVKVIECSGDDPNLMDAWEGVGLLIVVDTVSSGADPGTVFRIEVQNHSIPTYMFHHSTHSFTVAHTIELARLLGKAPPKMVIFGIEGEEFSYGERLSEEIALATEGLPQSILDYIENYMEETAGPGTKY
jgi:hydrogenase maturation protease